MSAHCLLKCTLGEEKPLKVYNTLNLFHFITLYSDSYKSFTQQMLNELKNKVYRVILCIAVNLSFTMKISLLLLLKNKIFEERKH